METKTFSVKEIRTEPACARHRSGNGPFYKQEDARGQSKPFSWERLAEGDDEVLQQFVRRPRIDHGGDPAQRDGKKSEYGVTEKPERKMQNQGDWSKSFGQVQTDCMSDNTEEIDELFWLNTMGRLKFGPDSTLQGADCILQACWSE